MGWGEVYDIGKRKLERRPQKYEEQGGHYVEKLKFLLSNVNFYENEQWEPHHM